MRSSGSTRSPSPERPLRLFLVVVGEDHPKACTGRRLERRGLVAPLGTHPHRAAPPLVLDPFAPRPLSSADRETAERAGVLAVDCSWSRLAERGRFPPHVPTAGVRRRLPLLVAANPQHYGRPAQLNTVEALSAAAYLLGHDGEAARLLEGFRGGAGFLAVNRERLEAYRSAAGAEEVLAAERRLFGGE
jgi:pre-rRNA-processing protein TSR3